MLEGVKRLIAVIRRPGAVLALVSERAPAAASGPSAGPYREVLVPLAAVSEAICPWKDKDVRAWRALARVPALSRRAGVAIVRTIIGSAVDPDAVPAEVAPLSFSRGPVNLQPYLCAADSEQELLDVLGDVLAEVSRDTEFPAWHWNRRHALAVLPANFRRSFLWGLHLSRWSVVEHTLAVYEALALDSDAPLRRALARLLSLADRPVGLSWSRVIADVDPGERLALCERIVETGAYTAHPEGGAVSRLVSSAS